MNELNNNLDPEADDYLHNPDPRYERDRGRCCSWRGIVNMGCITIIVVGIVSLFAAFPIVTYFMTHSLSTFGAFNLGGINGTGQVPAITGRFTLIDQDTPQSAYSLPPFTATGPEWQLVFSDEFNTDGRSFYPGDDPFWEAVDLWYWQTALLNWYDPRTVTTGNGSLQIAFTNTPSHDLNYLGGLVSSWNKFCFTGGILLASVSLPGNSEVPGLWPALWSMGNLGRAGYGASLEGMWPYTYDTCDVGALPNQTLNGQPEAALINGDPDHGGVLSYLPGQRLSRCTCTDDSTHPGPKHSDGTYFGRAAPEIDVFEATVQGRPGDQPFGLVSQSAQWAPFNYEYSWVNTTENQIIPNPAKTSHNNYEGGIFQQATSALTQTDQLAYTGPGGDGTFSVYGYEYIPGTSTDSYITWISGGEASWTLRAPGMGPDANTQISARPVPQEPMYIIANLGMSPSFGAIDFDDLTFPAVMMIDWIRVYQDPAAINYGCDTKEYPTQDYINQYIDAYTNPNFTTWEQFGQVFPGNRLLGQCASGT